MPRTKVTDADFWRLAGPLLSNPDRIPTLQELADATNLTVSGIRYRLNRYNIRRESRLILPGSGVKGDRP